MEEPSTEDGKKTGRWYRRLTLSLSAFIMSLTITVINAFYAVQGSEIVVQPPEHVLLYRDGQGDQAVLSFAVRLPMINAASGHGDLLLDATMAPAAGEAHLQYQSLVQPVFTDKASEAAEKCALGVRCLPFPGLLVMEQEDEILDVPAGAARSRYFAFIGAEWNCEGSAAECGALRSFDDAVATLSGKPLDLKIQLTFHQDGDRLVRCSTGKLDAAYLRKIGWISLACQNAEVTGEPLF